MKEEKRQGAIAYLEKTIQEIDKVLPSCSQDLRAELMEERTHFETAMEALQAPELTQAHKDLIHIAAQPREF